MVHLLEADLDRKKASVDELEGKLQGMANFVELVSKELDHFRAVGRSENPGVPVVIRWA